MAIAMRSLDATPYFAGYPFQGNYFGLFSNLNSLFC